MTPEALRNEGVAGLFQPRIFWIQSRALTVANLKTRYRNTVAGFLWVILSPLITFGAQSYVFHTILKLDVARFHLFLLTGLLPWIFLSQSVEMCTSLLTNSARLLKSFPVHPLVYLAAQLLDNLLNFLAIFLLILVPVALLHQAKPAALLLLPIPLFLLFLGVFGICWLLAVVQVFLRDTRFLVSFAFNILFYLTPIFYPERFVPQAYRWVILVNPVYYLIEPFRTLLYDYDLHAFALACGKAALVSGGLSAFALLYWRAKRNDVYHAL